MNPSPYTRFANGLSSAVVIAAVVACAYTAGKRISVAEAFTGQIASDTDTDSGQPVPTKPDSEPGLPRTGTAKSDSGQLATGAPVVTGGTVLASDAELLEFDATA